MTEPRIDSRGSCGCGWRGPWRTSVVDSHRDVQEHCAATGCVRGVDLTAPTPFDTSDLMPHERRP